MAKPFIRIFSKNRVGLTYGGSFLFVIVAMFIALYVGTVELSWTDITGIVFNHLTNSTAYFDGPKNIDMIIWQIRLPRVVLAFLVGASLSLAGAAFQGMLRNPLADPYTLGVSSGASLGAVVVLFFQFEIYVLGAFTLPVVAIAFGIVTLLLVFGITKLASGNLATETIILAGIILNSFIGAFISLLLSLSGDNIRQLLYWLMGSLSMKTWNHVILLIPFFIISAIILMYHYRELNGLSLGEQDAKFTGIDVKRKKIIIMSTAAMVTGAAVAVVGAIGFVGLVIPHFVRLLVGSNHRDVLPVSLLLGGGYLVFADLIARTITMQQELPIGVVTALIGAPVFTFLLVKERLRKRSLVC